MTSHHPGIEAAVSSNSVNDMGSLACHENVIFLRPDQVPHYGTLLVSKDTINFGFLKIYRIQCRDGVDFEAQRKQNKWIFQDEISLRREEDL